MAVHIYHDFEYNERAGKIRPILGCFLCDYGHHQQEHTFDLRKAVGRAQLAHLYRQHQDAIWLSYSVLAEATCFELLGLDARELNWVCLMAESKQILGSHHRLRIFNNNVSLLMALARFGIPSEFTKEQKDAMRDLIINNDEWTPEQWAEIVRYCWSDVRCLPPLWQRIQNVHRNENTPWTVKSATFHGDYLGALAHLEAHSPGFPINVELLEQFYSNLPLIKEVLITELSERYDNQLYLRDKKGEWHFKPGGLKRHLHDLQDRGIHIDWQLTEKTNMPVTTDEYLDEQAKRYPYFKPLAQNRHILNQLKRTDLRSLCHNGYIKGGSLPFHTVTSRNQPLPAKGFILNLPSWMRCLMQPPPGKVIVAADWSQQEVVLAAALPGDLELAKAIKSGDTYLYMGKQAGYIPADGTGKTHKAERDMMKTFQLGIQYGMGLDALARNLYLAMLDQQGMTYQAAYRIADQLMSWHKRTFMTYWTWKDHIERAGLVAGCMSSKDTWIMFTKDMKQTTLGNFPCQANGAAMMRQAVKHLAEEDVTFIASHHDAMYLLADEGAVGPQRGKLKPELPWGPTELILRRCMDQAATELISLSQDKSLSIRIDMAIYDQTHPYFDERGRETFERVMAVIHRNSAVASEEALLAI